MLKSYFIPSPQLPPPKLAHCTPESTCEPSLRRNTHPPRYRGGLCKYTTSYCTRYCLRPREQGPHRERVQTNGGEAAEVVRYFDTLLDKTAPVPMVRPFDPKVCLFRAALTILACFAGLPAGACP